MYLIFVISHAHAISALIAKSAGTMFAIIEVLQNINRSNPLEAVVTIPVGPYKLSIQPGIGS
jgi:hypothetical protein